MNTKNGIATVVILASIFGLVSGLVGQLFFKSFFVSSSYLSEINFQDGNLNYPNLVISGAKKVVVEQQAKISETINVIDRGLVGIFKKKNVISTELDNSIDSFYKRSDNIGVGMIITSDGWFVSDFLDLNIFNKTNLKNLMDSYIVINSDDKILTIDNILYDKNTGYFFFHADDTSLPVSKFFEDSYLSPGTSILDLNWKKDFWLSLVSGDDRGDDEIKSSDYFLEEVFLIDKPSKDFFGTFMFNLSGELVMLINKKGELLPVKSLKAAIVSLFEEGEILRPDLGIKYRSLSSFIDPESGYSDELKGALVEEVIPLSDVEESIDLLPGDIIISVDNVEINKDRSLTDFIMAQKEGDKIRLLYLRDNKEYQLDFILR